MTEIFKISLFLLLSIHLQSPDVLAQNLGKYIYQSTCQFINI